MQKAQNGKLTLFVVAALLLCCVIGLVRYRGAHYLEGTAIGQIPVAISYDAAAKYTEAWLRANGDPVTTPEIAEAFAKEAEQSRLESFYGMRSSKAHDRAFDALWQDKHAHHETIAELEATGKVYRVPNRTRIRIMRSDSSAPYAPVMILTGDYAGKIGYVDAAYIK